MTTLLAACLLLGAGLALYVAARVARLGGPPAAFLDAGRDLPGWTACFLLPWLVLAGLGLDRHLGLVARYGLQASHVAVGMALVAMAALLLWNRLWHAARLAGLDTPGEALGRYYGSITLRVAVLALALLFALPFAADLLSSAAMLIEAVSQGALPRAAGIWLLALGLAVPAIIGGWRAAVLTAAFLSLFLFVLLPGITGFAEIVLPGPGFPAAPIPVGEGILWDRLPGVVRHVAGIGKAVPAEGIFTTLAVSSAALALTGIVLSPAALYFGQTLRAGRALGLSTVWLTGGLAAGLLVLCGPVLALRMAGGVAELAASLQAEEPLAGAGFLLLLLLPGLMLAGFLVTAGALIWTRDLVLRYLFPRLDARTQRFAARVSIAVGFFLMAFMAAFLPLVSAVLATVALPLAVQLLPALLGLSFLRWAGRGAVLAGLTLGCLIVVFTEPPGLILFEGLFVDLPWGRWPLGIHSAAWGLAFNLLLVLLSAAATQRAPDRRERDRLHDALLAATGFRIGGRGLLWALALIWGFLAYGPGAILGNFFFSDPIFAPGPASALGIPSLWVWQILFWLLGVVPVWWLAYRLRFGRTSEESVRPIVLGPPAGLRPPDWLAAGIARVAGRGPRARPPATRAPRRAGRR
ncbi:MAG: hypothetical protein N2Z62_07420 [Rhodobacteraceae bacterium]|nr:hypothetical protein [Paracoccaceae bacterium]